MKSPLKYVLELFIINHFFMNAKAGDTAGIKIDSLVYSAKQHQLNFFIVSKPKKGKFDLASRFNIVRTRIRGFFWRKKFVSIVAANAEQMSSKVLYRLNKANASIRTLWFDSHGIYRRGHSLFQIGTDEFNFQNINDTIYTGPFWSLSSFCDPNTRVIIGSCYGGATFKRASLDSDDTLRMNGDSLMMGLAGIFKNSTVYGSESWVMTKPGLFKKTAAAAGYPLRRIFRDVVYRPVWEKVGVWNAYSTITKQLVQADTPTMDHLGNISFLRNPYSSRKTLKKKVAKNIKKLQPGLLKT